MLSETMLSAKMFKKNQLLQTFIGLIYTILLC